VVLVAPIVVPPQEIHSGSFRGIFTGNEPKQISQKIMCCLELVHLRGENISSHAHKTGSWYFLGVFFKIPDEHPRPFCMGVPLGEGKKNFLV